MTENKSANFCQILSGSSLKNMRICCNKVQTNLSSDAFMNNMWMSNVSVSHFTVYEICIILKMTLAWTMFWLQRNEVLGKNPLDGAVNTVQTFEKKITPTVL